MNGVTIFIENREPAVYDLDSFGTDYVRFGRGPFHGEKNAGKNDIWVPADLLTVSRAHCTFYKMGKSWYICDDKSVNGLSLNGVLSRFPPGSPRGLGTQWHIMPRNSRLPGKADAY